MACSESVRFVKGTYSLGLPHYHVDLTEAQLNTFEILNSMCLLDNFDHLLFFLECRTSGTQKFAVPPFDIFLVLMTLVTVSDHYKDRSTRLNDPYNVSRAPLNKRALKLLQFYLEKLKEFDTGKYGCYELELLRCQLFLASDSLSPRGNRSDRPRKLRKTVAGVVYNFEATDVGNADFKEPYKSYISCLGQKRAVLGNRIINAQLSHPGEFINMILWTVSNSMQEQQALYLACHDVWMPLLEIILDLLELRQDYFISEETKGKKISNSEYVQKLSRSPVAIFLETIDSLKFTDLFCEYVFSKCDYLLSGNSIVVSIHPVYRGEDTMSSTFHSRVKYTKPYKIKKSLVLRRRLVGMCFKLLSEVPKGHILVYPRMNADDLLHQISVILSDFRNLNEFRAFFSDNKDLTASYFLPLLAEGTLWQIYLKFKKTSDISGWGLITDLLCDANAFLDKCVSVLKNGMFVSWNKRNPKECVLDICKADACFLVLAKTFIRLPGTSPSPLNFETILSTTKEIDSKRSKYLPKLHPAMVQLIDN